ncbi:MAG: addiction module protein [Nitrospirota bacterium]
MPLTVERIYTEAMSLPNDSKSFLVEKLVASIESNIDAHLERLHITYAKRRRDEIRYGKVQSIPGEEALAKVKGIIKK